MAVIKRNLPIDTKYSIVASRYSKIEDGMATSCDNCGKLISNVATVEDINRQVRYEVGMDCAATLSGLKGSWDFEYLHKARFTEAKSARSGLMKKLKKDGDKIESVTGKTFEAGEGFYKEEGAGCLTVNYKTGASTWKQYPADTWQNYVLPMIKDLLT